MASYIVAGIIQWPRG